MIFGIKYLKRIFDEHFFAYLEDMDISYRARTLGYKNLYASKAEIYHLGSATSGSRYNGFKAGLTARNNIFLIYKNMPLLQLIINLPFLILGFLVKYLFYVRKLQTIVHKLKKYIFWIDVIEIFDRFKILRA